MLGFRCLDAVNTYIEVKFDVRYIQLKMFRRKAQHPTGFEPTTSWSWGVWGYHCATTTTQAVTHLSPILFWWFFRPCRCQRSPPASPRSPWTGPRWFYTWGCQSSSRSCSRSCPWPTGSRCRSGSRRCSGLESVKPNWFDVPKLSVFNQCSYVTKFSLGCASSSAFLFNATLGIRFPTENRRNTYRLVSQPEQIIPFLAFGSINLTLEAVFGQDNLNTTSELIRISARKVLELVATRTLWLVFT